jgi:DNA-binding NarL/FixJ family response regulator
MTLQNGTRRHVAYKFRNCPSLGSGPRAVARPEQIDRPASLPLVRFGRLISERSADLKDPICIRLLSVDHHPLFREGIAAMIGSQQDMALVAQASGGQEAIQRYREHRPDITLMEARLPDLGGIDTLIAIRSEFPGARIIMLTSFEGDVEALRALEAGASGYLLKNIPSSELLHAIRQVHAGRKRIPPELAAELVERMGDQTLTTREVEVLMRVAEGNGNREIGELLCISEWTVKVHLKHILEKLGAKDRTDATAIGIRRGIIRI